MVSLKKLKRNASTLLLSLWVLLINAQIAFADVIDEKSASDVGNAIVGTVTEILYPLGAAVIFITIVVVAFKIIMSANNPNERASAIASLPYIIGGGVLLGGSLLIAGFIMNLFNAVQG